MDSVGMALGLAAARAAQTQAAVAMQILKQNAQAEASIVQLLQSSTENAQALASSTPPGMGQVVNISA